MRTEIKYVQNVRFPLHLQFQSSMKLSK